MRLQYCHLWSMSKLFQTWIAYHLGDGLTSFPPRVHRTAVPSLRILVEEAAAVLPMLIRPEKRLWQRPQGIGLDLAAPEDMLPEYRLIPMILLPL